MNIKRIKARNFLSFDSQGIDITDFGDVNSFVGPNNAGKTNLFRIASFIGGALKSYPSLSPSLPYYHDQNLNEPFEIEVSLDLAEEERGALSDSLICSHLMDQVNSIPALGANTPLPNLEPLRPFLLDFYGRKVFGPLFQSDFAIVVTAGKSESYAPRLWFRIESGGKKIYVHNFGLITTLQESPRGYGLITPGERIITDLAKQYQEFGPYLKGLTSERPALPQDYTPSSLLEMLFQPTDSGPALLKGFSPNRWSVGQLEQNYSGIEAFQRLRAFYRSRGAAFASATICGLFDTIRLIFLSSMAIVSDARGIAQDSHLENLESTEFPLNEVTYDRLPELLFKLKNSEFASERKRVKAISKVFSDLTDGLTFNVILRTTTKTIQQPPTLVVFPKSDSAFSPVQSSEESLLGIKSVTSERTIHELSIEIGNDSVDYPLELSAAGIAEMLFLATSIGSTTESVIFFLVG